MANHTNNSLRALPSVDRLARAVARVELDARREEILTAGDGGAEVDLVASARGRLRPSLTRVLNATGVIVHTNLGRAPLAPSVRTAVAAAAAGYSNLEMSLARGERSRRGQRTEALLCELTSAQDALVVNNGAAAALLAVSALAGPGHEVIVSRGELIEIGGGFRIPEIVRQSGSILVEIGTTNRTRARDYAAVIGERTGAILRVHQSNFQMSGFVERPALGELTSLGVPVIDDIGSGVLAGDRAGGISSLAGEPTARESLQSGATLTCFSGDKLLGGPQAGILIGAAAAIDACRRSPLARALRIDKLCLAGLEATLLLHRDPALARREIPVLAMLDTNPEQLAERTRRLAETTGGEIVQDISRVGGGALPMCELPGPAVALDAGSDGPGPLAAKLRAGDPALLARIHAGRVLLNARTLSNSEATMAGECVARVR
ncbi:MAG TPA: L-seryl-tRNA(Sec) selenium transferase [Solirubrobacteraceae bacterium]|nr:L-seryl-tRNA(Sec) selenium transferase [Solirubrobacteraceae bacterium]